MLLLAGAAIVALVLLSAGISQLEFLSGQSFSLGEGDRPQGVRGLAAAATKILEILFRALIAASILLSPFGIIYLIISRRARRQVLIRLVPLVVWVLLFYYLIRTRPDLFGVLGSMRSAGTPAGSPGTGAEFVASPPQWLVYVASLILALALVGPIAGAGWLIWRRRRREASPLEELGQGAQQAIEALRAGVDLKNVVMQCYLDMSRALGEHRGIWREQDMTPREFERRLRATGLAEDHVRQLTRLFEAVRYGAKDCGPEEERLAISCLAAIVEACKGAA